MGMDWPELMLDIEREHGIAVDWNELWAACQHHKPPDITVDSLHRYLTNEANRVCTNCKYLLKTLPCPGSCPECGEPYTEAELTFEQLRGIICELLGCKPEMVTPEVFMNKDLGMT